MSQELLAYVERYRSLVEAVVQARDFEVLAEEFELFYESILPFALNALFSISLCILDILVVITVYSIAKK